MALSVNGVGSPSIASDSNNNSAATVQVGENNLSQVAQRLGIDLNSLMQANPRLVDGSVNPGQDIHLPQSPTTQATQATPGEISQSSFPPAPMGDPMAKLFVQSQLDNKGLLDGPSGNSRQHLMYADPDGSGSGSASGVSTAAPNAAQGVQVASLKSPDVGLKTPSKTEIASLNRELQSGMKGVDVAQKSLDTAKTKAAAYGGSDINVIKKNSDDVAKAEQGLTHAFKKMDSALQDVVKAYGIGRDGATGLSYSPDQSDLGDTPMTASTISRDGLKSPSTAADIIMHESNHARRNQELADAGCDRGKLGQKAGDIYSALTEMEGDQLEIKNHAKLGTEPDLAKGAETLKQKQIDILKSLGAGDLADMAANGQFDDALKLFRQRLSVDPQTKNITYKK